MSRCAAALALVAFTAVVPAIAEVPQSSNVPPRGLTGVGYEQRIGAQVPLNLLFTNEDGDSVRLGDLIGDRPVVLALVYYECPMLCTLVLNGLTSAMKALAFTVGDEYDVIAVSFDPREGPELAAAKKAAYLDRYERQGASSGWHFLTGSRESIEALTEAVGFSYSYDADNDVFAHAAGVQVLTPKGRIARYLMGVEYAPRDLRLSLVEAAEERLGSVVDQVLLYCFHYDPELGRYTATALNLMRGGAVLTVLALAIGIGAMIRREGRRQTVGAS